MFPRESKSGSKYRDILFRPAITCIYVQTRCQARWPLGRRSLLQPDGFSLQQYSSSASSKRWQTRQVKDRFAINAKVQGLKSRAAFKLLEVSSGLQSKYDLLARVLSADHIYQIHEKYKIFRGGQTIVDLVCRLPNIEHRTLTSTGVCSWILVASWSLFLLFAPSVDV